MSYSQELNNGEEEEDDNEVECGQSSGTSVCGYDGDYDNDNETVCEEYECNFDELLYKHNINDNNNNSEKLKCFDQKTNKTINKEWIFVGSTVLSRWTDGLFYLGLIVQIDSLTEKCLIQFEDNSIYWTRFEDLHKQLSMGSVMADSDLLCAICRDGTSQTPNEIVICDVCNQGYHQKCHKPRIGDEILEPDIPWTCRLCVFALGTKEGGALKNGIIGKALKLMKAQLPYDLNELNWDELHQINVQQKYCYCSGPGNYYSKMLQCVQCMQWFHEACIQALETPLLYGDHYYTFKCAVCNRGKEILKRIIMKWSDMIALVINNLALQHGKRFFDLHLEIVTFVQNNFHMLKLSEDISKLTEDELITRISAVLKANENRFICGKEVRKKSSFWALRLPFPFETPLIFAPPFALQSSSSSTTSPSCSPPFANGLSASNSPNEETNSITVSTTPLIYGACRKGATKWPTHKVCVNELTIKRVQNNGRSNSCSSSTGSNSCNASTISFNSHYSQNTSSKKKHKINAIPYHSKAVKRQKCVKRVSKFSSSALNSDSSDHEIVSNSTIESLEVVIPPPKDFEGHNNPFIDTDHRVLRNCLEIANKKRSSTESQNQLNLKSTNDLSVNRISFKSEPSFNGDIHLDINSTSPKMECFLDSANQRNDKFNDKFNILAQRVKPDGKVEYLLEWNNNELN